jgi:hypothetical protein
MSLGGVFCHQTIEVQSVVRCEPVRDGPFASRLCEAPRTDVLPVRCLFLSALMPPRVRLVPIRQCQPTQDMVNQVWISSCQTLAGCPRNGEDLRTESTQVLSTRMRSSWRTSQASTGGIQTTMVYAFRSTPSRYSDQPKQPRLTRADQAGSDSDGPPNVDAEHFSLSPDGHIIGKDGFVVPADFQEFVARFSDHVWRFVRRHMPQRMTEDIQDRERELLCFLMALPAASIFRRLGVNGRTSGCTDRIMTFNPERCHGASIAQFLSFINRILRNHFISLEKKEHHEPLRSYCRIPLIDDEDWHPAAKVANGISVDQLAHSGVR